MWNYAQQMPKFEVLTPTQFVKTVALLLVVAVTFSNCSSTSTQAQVASGDTWQAVLSGGIGGASGLSFNTQFTVNADGSLNIESIQFLNEGTCFPDISGSTALPTANGTMILTLNTSTDQVTGSFSFTVQETPSGQSQPNILTLTGTVTGTETGSTFTNALITGTWTLAGSGSCTDTVGGSFSMTEQTQSS
jgi:hypothetical protein